MSPIFKIENGYQFRIFLKEEARAYVHVCKEDHRAKIWLEPVVELAKNRGFTQKEINQILKITKENEDNFKEKYRSTIG
ncbi:MAG: DUF4160 domain-containing protein [Tannerellaceae bacterium]|jgi:transcriptional regulator|nr:DUF4160 domain-containing protein [Tannerellaceae bacterium]